MLVCISLFAPIMPLLIPTDVHAQIYVPQDTQKKKKSKLFNWFGNRKTPTVQTKSQTRPNSVKPDRGLIAGINEPIAPIEFDLAATIGEVEDDDTDKNPKPEVRSQDEGLSLKQLQRTKSQSCSNKERKFLNTIRAYLKIKNRNDMAISNGSPPIKAVQTKNYKSIDSFMKSQKAPQYIELLSQKCK
jgi:hypothetical protein